MNVLVSQGFAEGILSAGVQVVKVQSEAASDPETHAVQWYQREIEYDTLPQEPFWKPTARARDEMVASLETTDATDDTPDDRLVLGH